MGGVQTPPPPPSRRWEIQRPSRARVKDLEIATSSDVNTDELAGSEKDRVSRPDTNAQPTPSLVFDPSVKVKT